MPNQKYPRFSIGWLTIALVQMDYTGKRLQIPQKRLQMPSGNPHCIHSTQRPRNGKSAPLCGSVSTASPLSSVVSTSRHLAPPSGLSHHHSIVVTAPPCSHFDAHAASAPSLGPRSASAPFFAPLPPPFFAPARRICHFLCPPPSAHPHAMQVALYSRSLFSSMRSTAFPVPPPGPCRSVHSSLVHFLRHLPASAVDLPLRVAARRVLCLFALLTIA